MSTVPKGLSRAKAAALCTLVCQNSALALTMRYTRTSAAAGATSMYIPTTAVIMAETAKMIVSLLVQLSIDGSLDGLARTLFQETVVRRREFFRMAVPALLYTLQNNLSYVAVSNLDGPTYQILCQSKILITALLSKVILSRLISGRQWQSLITLTVGVAMVQLDATKGAETGENSMIGFGSAILLCFFSGLAGVYFELVLKGTSTSLWVRNVQLALYGILIGGAGCWAKDRAAVTALGFFHGYSPIVWFCICLHSLGGIAVAVVVKYADNITKCFATSISIIVSIVLSAALFGTSVHMQFMLGAGLVLVATYLYNTKADIAKAQLPGSPRTPRSTAELALAPLIDPGQKQ